MPSPSPENVALMDDHFEALPFWLQKAGPRAGLSLIHVDAHLDVQECGLPPTLLHQFLEGADPHGLRGNLKLPWGGLHCGNFLYPALKSGLVEQLVWVVPQFLVPPDRSLLAWSRQELTRWIDLDLADYRSFTSPTAHRIEGSLWGRSFSICYSHDLPQFKGTVALDIDVDYFIRLTDDSLWQTPQELHQHLAGLRVELLTIATSLEGGYTPVNLHHLGQDCLKAWDLPLDFPIHYQAQISDRIWREIHREQYPAAQELLDGLAPDDLAGCYLQAIVSSHHNPANGKRPEDGLERLLSLPDISEAQRAQVLLMQAELCDRSQHHRAIALLRQALKLLPDRYDVRYTLAKRQRDAGHYAEAARTLRQTLQYSQDRVSGLEHLLELARTYSQLGQTALAQATHRQLQAKDVLGIYSMESILDQAHSR